MSSDGTGWLEIDLRWWMEWANEAERLNCGVIWSPEVKKMGVPGLRQSLNESQMIQGEIVVEFLFFCRYEWKKSRRKSHWKYYKKSDTELHLI